MARQTTKKGGSKPRNTTASKTTRKGSKTLNAASKTRAAKSTAAAPVNTANTAANNHAANSNSASNHSGAQVIPFRTPGWDRQNPWLVRQQMQHAARGFAPVSQRYNHSRGK